MTQKDVWQKTRDGDYHTKLPYKTTNDIRKRLEKYGSTLSLLFDGFPLQDMGSALSTAMAEISPVLRELEQIEANIKAYHDDDTRLYNEFRADLKAEFDTEDYPDEQAIFNLAWDEGHASGFGEVLNQYSSIVEQFEGNIRRTKNLMIVAHAVADDPIIEKGKCIFCEQPLTQPHILKCPVRLAEISIVPDVKQN